MNTRELKGRDIAAGVQIRRQRMHWIVPSQSGKGTYIVELHSDSYSCTCPDFELHACKCKHIYAVEHFLACDTPQKRDAEPEPRLPRPTYSQDWPSYNLAQTNEKTHFQALLHDLCRTIQEPGQTMGRPRLSLADMVFCAAFKVYSTVSARRFMVDVEDAHKKGYLSHMPCYNSIFKHFDMPELTPILRRLIEQSSLPMKVADTNFAVDSSGFSTCQFVRWYNTKYGREQEAHRWLKVHLMCGTTTNIVTSVEITGREIADPLMFPSLVKATARNFRMREVSADRAYSSRRNLELVEKHGATPYVPFKSNTTGNGRGSETWEQLYHYFSMHWEEFLEHYHQRSMVESTFAMIKAKFGASIRSKTDVAQVNELLCKVLCHNICVVIQCMYEIGIEPDF